MKSLATTVSRSKHIQVRVHDCVVTFQARWVSKTMSAVEMRGFEIRAAQAALRLTQAPPYLGFARRALGYSKLDFETKMNRADCFMKRDHVEWMESRSDPLYAWALRGLLAEENAPARKILSVKFTRARAGKKKAARRGGAR